MSGQGWQMIGSRPGERVLPQRRQAGESHAGGARPARGGASDLVAQTGLLLEQWLSNPTIRTRHSCEAASDPDALWAAAGELTISEAGLLGRLIGWRVPGTYAAQTFRDRFTSRPFVVLDESDHYLLAGLCGDIWAANPSLAHLNDPSEFRAWSKPRTARVLFAHWVAPAPGGALIISEVRVSPVDRAARLMLRSLWPLIDRAQGLIGSGPLKIAAHRAEIGWAGRTAA